MRDSVGNTGTASSASCATTDPAPDNDPPTPNPMTFASAPAAFGDAVITMTATTASDPALPIEYEFDETSGNPGGSDSGWQQVETYFDFELDAGTQYTYRVRARDSLGNTGSYSTSASATTDPEDGFVDITVGPGNTMTPDNITINVGDTVQWTFVAGGHNVWSGLSGAHTFFDNNPSQILFASTADPATTNPAGTTLEVTFDQAFLNNSTGDAGFDSYNYHCHIHGSPLHDGVITVGVATNLANADVAVSGTVSGSFTDTHTSDNVYESIQERESGGKPSNRHSFLEHKWTFNLPGPAVAFVVEAYHTPNAEADNFVFAYSTDDVNYIDMVTVTKTSDDDNAQQFSLPSSLTGNVFVRVKDTDQSQGNRNLDTIFIDQLAILTSAGGGGGDTTPPSPDPSTWSSVPTAGGSDNISMTATTATDPSTPVEYQFDETSGNGGGTDSGWQSSPSYTDVGLNASTTYTYRTQSRDSAGNTTAFSTSESATTSSSGCTPATTHVEALACSEVNGSQGRRFGRATITVQDNCGNPIAGATVTGTFTGDFNETLNAVTDANGVAVITTSTDVKKPNFTFCVDDITASGLTYNSAENVITCCSG